VPVGDDTDGLPEAVPANDDASLVSNPDVDAGLVTDPDAGDDISEAIAPTGDAGLTDDSPGSEPDEIPTPSKPRIRARTPAAERVTPSSPVAPPARAAVDDDHAWLDDEAGPVVRPYTLTGGRSRPVTSGLGLLTHVESLFAPDADLVQLQPEHRSILSLTRTALSVAELSARLDLPVGVVRILVGDLLQANLVSTFEADAALRAPDDDILQAVIDGLRAL
jgi:hypothetical protein